MHKDHSSVMGKGAHNNTQLTELVVAASRYQIDMLRQIEFLVECQDQERSIRKRKTDWKYHTFKGYYICSFSKLRHKAHQKVWKCSLTFPLQNGIVTFYENCTNNMLQSIN